MCGHTFNPIMLEVTGGLTAQTISDYFPMFLKFVGSLKHMVF